MVVEFVKKKKKQQRGRNRRWVLLERERGSWLLRTLFRPLQGDEGSDPAPYASPNDDNLLVRLGEELIDEGDCVLLPPATNQKKEKNELK